MPLITRVWGIVKGVLEGGIPVIDVKNSFVVSDVLEVLPVKRLSSPIPSHFPTLQIGPETRYRRFPSKPAFVWLRSFSTVISGGYAQNAC
jgi:hypothetical protein